MPEHVLVPLAVHRERRLMLLPDGGATLRAAGGASSVEAWEAMLRDYARLQVELVPHADDMVALGVPDLRPDRLPELVADLLDDDESLLLDRPGGLTAEVRDRLVADLGRVPRAVRAGWRTAASRRRCSTTTCTTRTSSSTTAGTGSSTGATHRSRTPSSACWSPLRVAAQALDVPNGDPVLLRLRDAYLDRGAAYGSPAELREQADMPCGSARCQRAMTWRRILRGVHPAERAEWQTPSRGGPPSTSNRAS